MRLGRKSSDTNVMIAAHHDLILMTGDRNLLESEDGTGLDVEGY